MRKLLALTVIFGLASCAHAAAGVGVDLPLIVANVERGISREEIRAAVERVVAAAPVCLPLPVVWWEPAAPFTVRFGPTLWRGAPIPEDAEQRLDDFVQMGFWLKHPEPQVGDGIFQYELTTAGQRYYRGHPFWGARASFCPPAERQLVSIVDVVRVPAEHPERFPALGFYPPVSLGVRFQWAGVPAQSWLPSEDLRTRYRRYLPESGVTSEGYARLFRVWRRNDHPIANAPLSGALETFCYDNVHNLPDECWPAFR